MPIIRFCLHHGLVSPETPLLPSNEATLIHFATHLSNTVSYGTIKVYLAAVKNLHTEFGFPLDFTSMPLLYKTLRGIICLQSVPKRMRYPITIMVLKISNKSISYNRFHSQDVDSATLWAALTLAFSGFPEAANSLAMAILIPIFTDPEQISILYLIFSVRFFLKSLLRSPKLTPSARQPSSL